MPIENSDDASSFEDEEEEIDDDIEVSTENDEEQSEGEDENEEEDDEDEEDESFEDDNLDDSSTIPPKNSLQNNKRKNIEAKVGYITKPKKTQWYYVKVIIVFILKCSQIADLIETKLYSFTSVKNPCKETHI